MANNPLPLQGGELEDYDVEVNGVKTTLRLTKADAERRGIKKSGTKLSAGTAYADDEKAAEPANKSKAPANK